MYVGCHGHSAKGRKPPAKPLPSVTLGESYPAYTSSANRSLPRARTRALGKDFAESQTVPLGKIKWLTDSRRCRRFLTCGTRGTCRGPSLPSATLGKESQLCRVLLSANSIFAECDSWQTQPIGEGHVTSPKSRENTLPRATVGNPFSFTERPLGKVARRATGYYPFREASR